MSVKERRRLAVLEQIRAGHLTVAGASAELDLSYRQARRVYRRFVEEGDAGLVHRARGRPGNRRIEGSVRDRAVAVYREHYSDFGCTLACEYLAERHDLRVDDQTLRRWLTAAGLWRRRRKSPKKRRRRERRACFGALVQIDGSHHDWFEGRGDRCVLMVMIDDATGLTLARFFESETTAAAMTIFRQWAMTHGLPGELYPDQDSIYRVNTKAADEQEARTGKRPSTQFGRAMQELGVGLTCAKSPQAKGRVERMNGTLQDRLVKALRVEAISDMESANTFLDTTFLPRLNARFTVEAATDADVHQSIDEADLDAALCVKVERKVGRDHCVTWCGRVLQLKPGRGTPSLAGRRVQVRQSPSGELSVHRDGAEVAWAAAVERPKRPAASSDVSLVARVARHSGPAKPRPDHEWRRSVVGSRP